MYDNSKIKFQLEKERLEDIYKEIAAYRQAKLVQGNQPGRIKALINNVIRFAKNNYVKPATQHNAQIQLHNEEALQ